MMTALTRWDRAHFYIVGVFILGAIVSLLFFAGPRFSSAQSAPLSGYAWSDTIGWISLSGSGYGIYIDASGNLSGHAWSEHIGWISAQAADVVGCPTTPCQPKLTGTAMSGWLRAISATGNGWDGWISLSGPGYGVSNVNGTYSGYAWGSDVVGWINFSTVIANAPVCSITPSSAVIVRGATASLIWTSTNATSGTITTIGVVSPNGSAPVQPFATTTYTGTFGGSGGYGSCQATVGVTCAPIYSCSGQTIQFMNAACATSNITTCTAPASCVSGQSVCVNPPPAFNADDGGGAGGGGVVTTGHLEAVPQLVRMGQPARLYWNVSNVASCTVGGSNGHTVPAGCVGSTCSSGATGQATLGIVTSTEYTLSCTALSGVTPSSFTETETVLPSPEFQER